jgi:high-affinity iron transporter
VDEIKDKRRLAASSPSAFGSRTWALFAAIGVGLLAYLALTAKGGVPDPTTTAHLSHGAVILNSGLLVLREGLEAILVLAAVTASFTGANREKSRPVAIGAGLSFAASVATWFIAVWAIGVLGGPALDVQAATGLLAVAVLLVVMNWFFHRMYWTGWIAHHHKRRRTLLASGGGGAVTAGLVLLGFTAVYREGFEIVLFLQSLRLKYGETVVLEGVGIGLAFTAAVGVLTFFAHRKLPYRRMLVLTGATIGFVLVVMVGESAQELQLAGWIGTSPLGVTFPGWVGTWFALFPTVETLAAQALAASAVIASYLLAEHVRVRRPTRQGRRPAHRPEHPPVAIGATVLARAAAQQIDT